MLLWGLVILVCVAGMVYFAAFTQPGNDLIRPYVQKQLRKQIGTGLVLQTFSLRPGSFSAAVSFHEGTNAKVSAAFNLFSRSLAGTYAVRIQDLKHLQSLHKRRLRGTLEASGRFEGTFSSFTLSGQMQSARGRASYSADVSKGEINRLRLNARGFSLKQLLWMGYREPLAEGLLHISADLSDLRSKPRGNVKFFVKKGRFNTHWLKNNYGITLEKSEFQAGGRANLQDGITYDAAFRSMPLSFTSGGKLVDKQRVDGSYTLAVPNLADMEPLLGYKLAGSFDANGSYSGSMEDFSIDLQTGLAGSKTQAKARFVQNRLDRLKGNITHASLQKLLQTANQKPFASGRVDVVFDLCTSSGQPEGTIISKIGGGAVDTELLQAISGADIGPYNTFGLQARSRLEGKKIQTKLDINSDLARIQTQKLSYNRTDNTLFAPLGINIGDLSRLDTLTGVDMQGSAAIEADFIYDPAVPGGVLINAKTDSFGGSIDMAYEEDTLQATGKAVSIQTLLHTLKSPKLLQGKSDFSAEYDLAEKKGRFRADLDDSRLSENFFTKAIKRYRGIDLSSRPVEEGFFQTDIQAAQTRSDFTLRLQKGRLQSRDLFIDTETGQIRGTLDLRVKDNDYRLGIEGNTDNLQEAVDYKSLLQKEIRRQIEKKAKEKLKQNLGESVYEKFKGLF